MSHRLSPRRWLVIALTAVVLAGAVGWLLTDRSTAVEQLTAIGGPFELTDQNGETVTQNDLLGRPHVVYFGFTFCPDLCPTTLFQLASIVEEQGIGADDLTVAFVSVDPERDTVDVVRQYVRAFHDDFVGLTGSPEAVDKAAKAYRIFYQRVPLEGGGYTVDHSASALLFDADGNYVDRVTHDETTESAGVKIVALVAD